MRLSTVYKQRSLSKMKNKQGSQGQFQNTIAKIVQTIFLSLYINI